MWPPTTSWFPSHPTSVWFWKDKKFPLEAQGLHLILVFGAFITAMQKCQIRSTSVLCLQKYLSCAYLTPSCNSRKRDLCPNKAFLDQLCESFVYLLFQVSGITASIWDRKCPMSHRFVLLQPGIKGSASQFLWSADEGLVTLPSRLTPSCYGHECDWLPNTEQDKASLKKLPSFSGGKNTHTHTHFPIKTLKPALKLVQRMDDKTVQCMELKSTVLSFFFSELVQLVHHGNLD